MSFKIYASQDWVNDQIAALPTPDFEANAIIDVIELPTENINENVFYRLLSGVFSYNRGLAYSNTICHCVTALPAEGEPVLTGDLSNVTSCIVTVYYNVNDNSVSGYVDNQLAAIMGIPAGWYPCADLMSAFGFTFSGIITDIKDDPKDDTYRLLLQYRILSYKNNQWIDITPIAKPGTGNQAVTLSNTAIASGMFSVAEGYGTTASGYASHAEGENTIAEGDWSHAEGKETAASGEYSHAEGCDTTASSTYSHAEGKEATASGYVSHAEGGNTTASGEYSHAEGYETTASSDFSHAEGFHTIAASYYQHAQGKFNIEDTNDKYAHIVGNGTSGSVRSNAHTLDWDGNAWFQGGIKVGGISQDDTNAKEVAITEYVDNAVAQKSQVQIITWEADD